MNAILRLILLVPLIALSACGGSGSSPASKVDSSTEVRDPSAFLALEDSLYEDTAAFYPGQAIYVRSSQGFREDRTYYASDISNREIKILGLSDGAGVLVLPSDLSSGEYSIKLNGVELPLNIDSIVLPEEPEDYVEQVANDILVELRGLIAESSDSQSELLVEVHNMLEQELAGLSGKTIDELVAIANALYANGLDTNSAFSQATQLGYLSPRRSSLSSSFTEASSVQAECASARLLFLGTFASSAFLAGGAAVTPEPLTKVVAIAAFVFSVSNTIDFLVDVVEKCPGAVISRLINSLLVSNSSSQSMIQANDDGSSNTIIQAVSEPTIETFLDGQTKTLNVIIETIPDAATQSYAEKLLIGLAVLKQNLPVSMEGQINSYAQHVNSLLEPTEKNITEDSRIIPYESSDISCSGVLSNHQCGFAENGNLYGTSVSFLLTVEHPSYGRLSSPAEVSPRGIPVVPDQTFFVTPGPDKVNRLEILAAEDAESPTYEFEKVIGFELVEGPSHGVILNEFNELNILDYAADITESMPSEEILKVRAWNRYGYSETASITLKLDQLLFSRTELNAVEGIFMPIGQGWYCRSDAIVDWIVEEMTLSGSSYTLRACENSFISSETGSFSIIDKDTHETSDTGILVLDNSDYIRKVGVEEALGAYKSCPLNADSTRCTGPIISYQTCWGDSPESSKSCADVGSNFTNEKDARAATFAFDGLFSDNMYSWSFDESSDEWTKTKFRFRSDGTYWSEETSGMIYREDLGKTPIARSGTYSVLDSGVIKFDNGKYLQRHNYVLIKGNISYLRIERTQSGDEWVDRLVRETTTPIAFAYADCWADSEYLSEKCPESDLSYSHHDIRWDEESNFERFLVGVNEDSRDKGAGLISASIDVETFDKREGKIEDGISANSY